MMIPRDYQVAADEALWQAIHNNPNSNPLVVLPTGTGKSLCIAMFIWRMLHSYPDVRVLALTHVKELIDGNHKTLMRLWPQAPAGVYSAGLNRRDSGMPVTFAGIQSVASRVGEFGKIDFLLIDEAHLVNASGSTMYANTIAKLKAKNKNLITIGYTATPFRMGLGSLTDGKLFDRVVFDGSDGEAFVWFIQQGYLIRPVPKDPGFQLDDTGIKIVAGEYSTKETSAALLEQNIVERAVDQMVGHAKQLGRRCCLTFCQSIEDAELVADMFRYKGLAVEAVHSKRSDRDEVLRALAAGELWGVTNKDILTTGFDHPPIDLIGMLRKTRSPGLWVQMLGRGTRPVFAPGFDLATVDGRLGAIAASHKQTCTVLDFVGNTELLGPINYPVLPKRRGKGGTAPTRKCPKCKSYWHTSVVVCEECGYEFPKPKPPTYTASTKELVRIDLATPPEPKKIDVVGVHRMLMSRHKGRNGKADTLRVDYYCGVQRYSSWIGFEHPARTLPRIKAEEWWRRHGGVGPAPSDIDIVLEAALNKPKFLKVWSNTRYPEIMDYDFRGTKFGVPPEAGGPPLSDPGPDPLAPKQIDAESIERAREMFDDDIPF